MSEKSVMNFQTYSGNLSAISITANYYYEMCMKNQLSY